MIFYSPATGGFYSSAIHRKNIPADALEITSDQHRSMLAGLAAGQIIVVEDGVISLIEGAVDLAAPERAWRDFELVRVSWLRDRHRDESDLQLATTLTGEQFEKLLGYMQALREWPQSEHFPGLEQRPRPPAWI